MRQLITYMALTMAMPMMAQLNNTVEVTNEVKPVVTDAKKVDVKMQAAETQVKHYTMEYAVQGQPLGEYAEEPLGDYASEAVWKGNKRGYLHLSGGNQSRLDGQVAYQFDLSENDALTVDFSLKGFDGRAKDNDDYGVAGWKSRDYRNATTLKYNHRFENGVDLFAKGAFENRLFNYMGHSTMTDKQHDVLGGFDVGFTPYRIDKITIGAAAGVDFFSQNYLTSLADKLGETFFHVNADAAYEITDEHSVGLGLAMVNSSYGNDELKGITRFRFTPHYIYNIEKMRLKLGLFVSSKGNLAPDVELAYRITPQAEVYLTARGYEEDNHFRHFSDIHPYFCLNLAEVEQLEDEFHQVDARIGFRFKGKGGFSGDINGGFDTSKNHANMDWISNSMNGLYYPWMWLSKSKTFYVNADFAYAYRDVVKLSAKNRLNIESNKYGTKWLEGSYISPGFEMDWQADFRLIKDLYLGLDWEYAWFNTPDIDVVPGPQYERPNTLNFGASIRYTLPLDWPLTVFVKGDNLFNQKYDRYFGYRHLGTTFLAGFALSF